MFWAMPSDQCRLCLDCQQYALETDSIRLLAPLSELYGRTPLYHASNIIFLITAIICALSRNIATLIVFRFLCGCAGAAPVAIGAGTIADLIPPQARGSAIASYSLGPILGPVLGPVIGGYFAVHFGWRSTFWALAAMVCRELRGHRLRGC